MKKVLWMLVSIALAATFALPALAQDAAQQDNEARAALYEKFLKLRSGDAAQQKAAHEAGKEYLSKYSNTTDPDSIKIVEFIQNWVKKYEQAVADYERKKSYDEALRAKNWARVFEVGNQILAAEPDNAYVIMTLQEAGYLNSSSATPNKSLNSEAIKITKRAIELVESGRLTPEQLKPFNSKEEALSWLTYRLGYVHLDSQPEEATRIFLKVVQMPGPLSKDPSPYDTLAFLYTKEYQKAHAELIQQFPDGTEITPERKPEYDRLLQRRDRIADRILDAYGRAVALSTKPEQQSFKNKTMEKLTAIYKSRNNDSDGGLKEFIAGILSKPLPIPGQEPPPPVAVGNPQTSQTDTPAPAATSTAAPKPASASPATPDAKPKPSSTAPPSTAPKPISKKAPRTKARRAASGR